MSLKFGTSGVRGLITELTANEVYLFTKAFIRYLKSRCDFKRISVSGDLRSSTPEIMKTVIYTIKKEGLIVDYCGKVATPVLMFQGLNNNNPGIMITGSHIPDDRNGIKFNMPWGEVLKSDEQEILKNYQKFSLEEGISKNDIQDDLPSTNTIPEENYIKRYKSFFPENFLKKMKVVVYQHSSVSRDVMFRILNILGAEVILKGYSEKFIPVDTEAVENIHILHNWIKECEADVLISTDGDGDRPLLIADDGQFVPGDVLGILTSLFLNADFIATPVSSNTAVEKSGFFQKIQRTKIGSPYVIEAMKYADKNEYKTIVGYEANGGFLTNSDIKSKYTNEILTALPTRDAILPLLSVLALAKERNIRISELLKILPARYTYSDLIRNFPTEKGKNILEKLKSNDEITKYFNIYGKVIKVDWTDGCRIYFDNEDILHFRPSGNAPEFRCYSESNSIERAKENNNKAMGTVLSYI